MKKRVQIRTPYKYLINAVLVAVILTAGTLLYNGGALNRASKALLIQCGIYSMLAVSLNICTGYLLGIKAFVAAVLGGIGSIPGAMLGGLAIGMVEVIVNALGYTTWADAVVYAILIIVLLVKPTGFLGRTMREKV